MKGRDHLEAVGLDGVQCKAALKEMEWGGKILE
jgi:hypothetical protein